MSGRYSLYPAILLVPRAGSILPLRVESPSASLATLQFFINILVLDEDSFGLTESIETTYTIGTHLVWRSRLIINAYENFLPTHFEQAVLIAQLNVDYVIQLDMKYSSTTKEEARERVRFNQGYYNQKE